MTIKQLENVEEAKALCKFVSLAKAIELNTKPSKESGYPIYLMEIGLRESIRLGVSPTVDRPNGRFHIIRYKGDSGVWYNII